MILLLFLLGLALGAEPPSDDQEVKLQRGGCPSFWYSFKGRCYRYIATHLTWADAELRCVSLGGNLVSIHSLDEHSFVTHLIKNFGFTYNSAWIGLSDIHKEGRWMWSDGRPVVFTFWATGEPNSYKGNEDCAHIDYGKGLKWNDNSCYAGFPSVCAARIHNI
ncbi:uncharacterized protein V6R79_001211 [Siganus canaliculatus]